MSRHNTGTAGALALTLFLLLTAPAAAQPSPTPLSFEQLAAIRSVGEICISPDGDRVAFTLSVPRRPGQDEDGGAWTELHLGPWEGPTRAWVHGEVNVSAIRFSPDGRFVTYLAKRHGDEEKSLWAAPVDGGESIRLVGFETAIDGYAVAPDGRRVAFVARAAEGEARKKAKEKGYAAEVFEEDWRPRLAWLVDLPDPQSPAAGAAPEPEPLEIDGSVFDVNWSPDGAQLALSVAPTPLIDDRYMHRRIHVVRVSDGETRAVLRNSGKLGRYEFSPDGRWIAMISAADPSDPAAGRLMLAPAAGGALREMLPGIEGGVHAFAWNGTGSLLYVADLGVETELGLIDLAGERTSLLSAGASGLPVLTGLASSRDGSHLALKGESPQHPGELFAWAPGDDAPRRMTDSNPWLADVALASQEVLTYEARDGLELQALLIRPLAQSSGDPAPLILIAHGGPESHFRNGWLTSYSRPGQLAAGRGYAVVYPNYRGSTGRGVEFSKLSQGDAAGKEFDDLIDTVDHLVETGVADRDRVGITGGSYGGYATAWCATRYTDRFKAGVMFVGISNKISKGLTTEIPVEDRMVHTLFQPYTRWQYSLERSPIYHVEQSRTALLIAGGTADSRVHPSQSLQLYRALKLIDRTPVRYVRYPGEGHGNRRAAGRDDYARRLMRWMDHFVIDGATELPSWDLGLGVGEKDSAE